MKKKKPIVNQGIEYPEGKRPFASWEKIEGYIGGANLKLDKKSEKVFNKVQKENKKKYEKN